MQQNFKALLFLGLLCCQAVATPAGVHVPAGCLPLPCSDGVVLGLVIAMVPGRRRSRSFRRSGGINVAVLSTLSPAVQRLLGVTGPPDGEEASEEEAQEQDPTLLPHLPVPPGNMDLDLMFWPTQASSITTLASDFTLSNWFWSVKPLGNAQRTVQLTDPPHMVRLLDFGNIRNQCISMNGLDRERRKALLAEELNKLGRKVALRSFTGVLAKQRQTIWGADLVSALERAGEYWVAVATLNQKSTCFVQAPFFGTDDCLSRMADLPEQVNGVAMPAGILDFGLH